MTTAQLDAVQKVHFIGIGGVSMSALALLMLKKGCGVSGSDMQPSDMTEELTRKGAIVHIGHRPENVGDCDLVVYTAAVKSDNPELIAAKEKGLETIERAVLLGTLMKNYEFPVGVCGTHGKTTVTSMISCILLEAGLNPTITVGANLPQIGGNLNIGSDKYFVFESCEYCNSFLNFYPYISVFTNIEQDHLDFFKGIEDIIHSFRKYSQNTHENGIIVYNADDSNVLSAIMNTERKKMSFGIHNGEIKAENIIFVNGCGCFDCKTPDGQLLSVNLPIPGEHNIYNALSAIAASLCLGVPADAIKAGLEGFSGASRRFELKYRTDDFTIVDDYAHHPSEIEATLTAAKKMGYTGVICIFQPHTYTRTKALLDDFARALSIADKVVVAKIYPAREKDIYNISSKDLADKIEGAKTFDSFDEIADYVRTVRKPGNLILTMGAGDIFKAEPLLH